MRSPYMVLRNYCCGLLALAVIASGRVRRARRRALGGDVVTAIYFHKPNRRLLEHCLGWLIKYGYTFISEDDLLEILYRGKKPPRGAVWLSFDDGLRELLENVLPLVRQRRIPVTLFIPSGIVEGDGHLPWLDRRASFRHALTVAEVKQVTGYAEVTIGSHTVNHTVTTGLAEETARTELGESKHTLESWTGADIKSFSYPEGKFDGRERPLLAETGYRLAVTTQNALITHQTDPYLVPRFSIGDEISFPEAICNMVGMWRPAIDPLIHFLQRKNRALPGDAPADQDVSKSSQSVRVSSATS